ncbi:MAG: hypothetical protein WCL29_07300 [Pseudomonadota bacterium]
MPILDFKEIPDASAGPQRDAFELFAREFLQLVGFKILKEPNRGADAGSDLIAEECCNGIVSVSQRKWLVSCKHKAHSGKSVSPQDESDIADRVNTHNCDGFIGFYSTIPSSGLAAKFNAKGLPYEVHIYDQEKIEGALLTNPKGRSLAKRFFPNSINHYEREHPLPAEIFSEPLELPCAWCGKNLLEPTPQGLVVLWSTSNTKVTAPSVTVNHYIHLYCCCRGDCDLHLKAKYSNKDRRNGWYDLSDFTIPTYYMDMAIGLATDLHKGHVYSDEAYNNYKQLLVILFSHVSRNLTKKEKQRLSLLDSIPPGL